MTQATEKLDLDHLRQWIGKTTEATDIVTAQLVKGLRATLFQDIGEPKPGVETVVPEQDGSVRYVFDEHGKANSGPSGPTRSTACRGSTTPWCAGRAA